MALEWTAFMRHMFLGVIGKLFGDVDLKDVMAEAGSLEKMLLKITIRLHWNKTNKNYTGMLMNR